ncbi:MAG: NUDIX hydrolase [Planctomycetota bacterium]|jgi:ADP-ribose pyrophosphatase YjhB (NUDIX family)
MTQEAFDWFDVAKRLKAISQAGKAFAKNEYEMNRHEELEQIVAEIMAGHTGQEPRWIQGILQEDAGYPTPKVDSRGVVFKDDKVLMVREIADNGWTLPGGWCDTGQTPAANAAREVWEESGYEVRASRLLAVYDRDNQGHTPPYMFSIYKMFFLCELLGGEATVSNETSEVRWFGEDELPGNDELSRGRTLRHELELFFRQYRDPSIPADFD